MTKKRTTAAAGRGAALGRQTPGGIPSEPDQAAKTPEMVPLADTVDLHPGDVLDENLTVHRAAEPEAQEATGLTEDDGGPGGGGAVGRPPYAPHLADVRAVAIGVLRQIVLGVIKPGPGVSVTGAAVSFCYREKKWRDAIALRADVDAGGKVLVDLEWGDRQTVLAVPYGDSICCWKFRAE